MVKWLLKDIMNEQKNEWNKESKTHKHVFFLLRKVANKSL